VNITYPNLPQSKVTITAIEEGGEGDGVKKGGDAHPTSGKREEILPPPPDPHTHTHIANPHPPRTPQANAKGDRGGRGGGGGGREV